MPEQLIKLSVSRTNTFESCRLKYKFTYIHKLPRKEFTYHVFGRFVHRVLELFHLAYIEGETAGISQTMSRVFKETLREKEFEGKIDAESKKEAFDILDRYLKKIIVERTGDPNKRTNVLAVEKNFNIDICENVKLIGMIDKVQMDPDGVIHVADYKTTKNKKYLEGDSLQLLTYAYVLLQEDPSIERVRGSYVLLRHNFEEMKYEYTREEILKVKEIYEGYANDIDSEREYPANTTPLCRFCDFIDSCPAGQSYINGGYKSGMTSW